MLEEGVEMILKTGTLDYNKSILAKENFIWLKKMDPFAKLTKEKLGPVLTQTSDVHP